MYDRSHLRNAVSALIASVLVVGLSGCGAQEGGKLVPVAGKVTVGGKPLTKGTVLLSPDTEKGNNSTEVSRGMIDADGKYTILTNTREGAPPGWYKIAVVASEEPELYKTVFLVPQRYIDHRTSKLAFEAVENAAAGAYDLKLEDK